MASRVRPTEVLRDPRAALDVLPEWRALAARVRYLSYFATPDWVVGWWETLGRSAEAEIAVWRDASGELEAVVALGRSIERIHRRVPWRPRAWTNLGSGAGAADHCGWPLLPHVRDSVRAWIRERAAETTLLLRDFDPAMGSMMPESARRVASSACPRLAIPPEDDPLGASSSSRKKIRAIVRRVVERGVEFRWVAPGEMDARVLGLLFDLHGRRQRSKGERSTFDERREDFHRRLVERGGPEWGPAAILAEAGGEPIGVLYGFLWGDVFAYYQSGWDPRWARESLGTALVAQSIRLAGRSGATVFDFLRGAEHYKYRFGAEDRIDGTWLMPTGLSGRLLHLKYRGIGARTEPGTEQVTEAASATGTRGV